MRGDLQFNNDARLGAKRGTGELRRLCKLRLSEYSNHLTPGLAEVSASGWLRSSPPSWFTSSDSGASGSPS